MSDPLPTFDALRKAQQIVGLTPAAKRLFWALQGPLSTAIFVQADDRDIDSPREPYCQQTLAGTSWHPVSQEALTEPGISSISVEVTLLSDYPTFWEDYHRYAEPEWGVEGCVFGALPPGEGDLDEHGNEYDDYLLRCCELDRPRKHIPLVVRASNKPYITIHDYVTAVHPWLMGRGMIFYGP